MAYVVGSASVEIVPDFRNAQLAITAFFNKQQNELRIPVRPDISPEATRDAEQQARATGARVGKAMADAAEKEAEKQRQRDRRAQERLGEQMARDVARSLAARGKAQETAAARELAGQIRLGAQMARETEKAIAVRAALEEKAAQDRIRRLEEERQAFLKAGQDRIDAMRKAMAETRDQNEKIRLQVEIDREQAIMAGRTVGGLLARSIHAEVRQNAGLITAAVTGALIAGAPAASLAATGLFVGIAAVGAFQSQKLRETWIETFDDIRIAGVNDTAVLVPAFERMAVGIGNSFQRMRPQIREGLADAPILIDMFTESLTEAAENAVPGLVRSVQNGRPVMQGFGNLMESLGQGTTDFLDEINEHAPAAGQSLTGLGEATGELLPLLGELLGEGAELGTIVLPVLTSALGGARSVVESLGGSLPILASGFLAFRTVQGSSRFVNQFAQSLQNVAPNVGVFTERLTNSATAGQRAMTATGRVASAAAGLGRILPGVGIGVAVLAAGMANASQEANDYAQGLLKGGAAARQAMKDASDNGELQETVQTWTGMGFVVDLFTADAEEAAEKADDLESSMSGLELASTRAAKWTEELAYRLGDESSSAEDVAIAQRKVAEYSAKAAAEQEQLETAVRGVTEAMVEQAIQARARVDADFAYQQSLLDVQDASIKLTEAQDALNTARAEGNPAEIAAAELGLKQAILDTNTALGDQVAAAEKMAVSKLPAALDDNQKAILGQKAALDELNAIMAAGIPLPPGLEQYRQQLINITGEADGAKLAQAQMVAALEEVGVAVSAIPNSKSVQITAPTEELRQRLMDLGFSVKDIPGTKDVRVTAVTDEAEGHLGELSTLLVDLGLMRPTPVADLNPDPLQAGLAEAAAGVQNLDGQTPTPVADLEQNPLGRGIGLALGVLGNLDRQRPKPVADANIDPLARGVGLASAILGDVGRQRPTPTVDLIDAASAGLRGIQGLIGGIKDKTVTITTKQVVQAVTSFQLPGFGGASGGAIEDLRPRYKFDGGGAVYGRGGPRDDLIPAIGPNPFARYQIANGEHILDGRDVALMGGQAGVYAFREALNSGAFSGPSSSTGIREMVTVSGGQAAGAAAARPSTPPRKVSLYTPDVPAALRELKALEHREEVLASPWP